MRWNWQRPDWPKFQYDAVRLHAAEAQFLKGAGVVVGTMHHLDGDAQRGLTIEIISQETVDTSAIEGEVLDRASVQSSVAKQLGFAAPERRANAAEAGAAELMVDLYQSYAQSLTDQQLFDWHKMLMHGRRDIKDIGAYRTHADPMQIGSGPLHAPNVHYEAPPSERVAAEMQAFIQWFNGSAPKGPMPLAAVTRAAIAHLWFESIHPFEDGNGRIGRAIAEKALAQALEAPTVDCR